MNLADIASILNLPAQDNVTISGISIDSRKVRPGDLFIAISGAHFDGHDFVEKAVDQGAAAILAQKKLHTITTPQLIVGDTLKALGQLATAHRQRFHIPVIALTGSNGKTTVKEMIASILPPPSLATSGNYNNHIGVPLSILQLQDNHRYAVFELGANHIGEIAYTVAMAKPDVSLINNIAPAHIEGFGSIDGVARAKGEIYQGLSADGIAVINQDDSYAQFWDDLLDEKRILRFSITQDTPIHTKNLRFNNLGQASFDLVTPKGEVAITLQVPGKHNVQNALAAASCAYAVGINLKDIAKGLAQFQGVGGRMTFRQGRHHALIIDDTYNANLRSVISALEVLSQYKGQRILVLGDLGELGQWSHAHHQQIGQEAKALGIDTVLTVGNDSQYASESFGLAGHHYQTQSELVDALLPQLNENTTVLVKGSRSAAMERVVQELIVNAERIGSSV